MRIALAQINPTLGNFKANADLILKKISDLQDLADLIVFPECALFGYHPFDLLEVSGLVKEQNRILKKIHLSLPKGLTVILGVISENSKKTGRPYFNSAAVMRKGRNPAFAHKELLPTGDVFDEARFIEAGETSKNIFNINGLRCALTICEDIWAWPDPRGRSQYSQNPILKLKGKFDLVINLSASPYFPGKLKQRLTMIQKTARHLKAPMVYCNMVGAQDEIIFDGQSLFVTAEGKVSKRLAAFKEDHDILRLESNTWTSGEVFRKSSRPISQPALERDELSSALILGIKDFCRKTGFKKVHLGLSGGIDSGLVAALASEAMGPENVLGVFMPTDFTTTESYTLARTLAANLKIEYRELEIQALFEQYKKALLDFLKPPVPDLVFENLQARIRALALMAISNCESSLLLGTSNKSELAMGYSTLYGDLAGGLLPIGDLLKKQVFSLSKSFPSIPRAMISRAPSAELRHNQKDENELGPYSKIDRFVELALTKSLMPTTHSDLKMRLLRSEFKRWQAPPILKVSRHAFGRGRRWPIAHQI